MLRDAHSQSTVLNNVQARNDRVCLPPSALPFSVTRRNAKSWQTVDSDTLEELQRVS